MLQPHQRGRVHPRYRDGLLALAGLVVLAGFGAATVGIEPLFDPVGIVAGIAVAVGIEAVFVRYPTRALGLWERRGVPVVGLCTVLVAGALAGRIAPGLVAVPVWGLIGYLGLLGSVLLGFENPVSVLVHGTGEFRSGRGREGTGEFGQQGWPIIREGREESGMDPEALRSEVEEWVRDDVITERQAEAILARYEGDGDGDEGGRGETHPDARSRVVLALSVVGAALVLVGVVLFLATNWNDLPTAAQVAVLLAGPGLAYLGGAVAYRHSVPRAGLALSLLGAVLVGPSLFLLADLAPASIDESWLLFAWTAVTLATGHALVSRVGTGLGLAVLAALVADLARPGEPAVSVGLLGIGLFALAGSRVHRSDRVARTYRTVGAALVLGCVLFFTTLDGRFDRFEPTVSATSVAVAAGAVLGTAWLGWQNEREHARWAAITTVTIAAGTVVATITTGTLPGWAGLGAVHVTSIATVGATALYGYRTGSRWFVDLAAVTALAQSLSFVAATVVDALSGSIALVVAGGILIGAGIALERGRRTVLARLEGAD